MKIISWNINSLRMRINLLRKFIEANQPDIVCLQEIKVEDQLFPINEIKDLGYNFVEFSGEKSYNGVAIISRIPLFNINKIDILNYSHKRHISAQINTKVGIIDIHNFYIPAGGDIADPILNNKFDHKLKFIDWMRSFFEEQKQFDRKIIILGDFNVAPHEHDVWSHKQLLNVVSHTPIEVEKLNKLKNSLEFIDTHRLKIESNEKIYSWWSYRALDPLKSNRGRRLDHIWITANLKKYLLETEIYVDYRTKDKPSDHVPIETTLHFIPF
jgi:exodeoxyribonuclease-3